MSRFLAFLARLFAPIAGSVKGSLIGPEIQRAFVAALGASTLAGGAVIFLQTIATDAPGLTTSPALAAAVTFILTQLAAQVAQLGQGRKPVTAAGKPITVDLTFPPLPEQEPEVERFTSTQYGRYLLVRGFQAKRTPIFEHWASLDLWRKNGCPDLPGMRPHPGAAQADFSLPFP